jgi:hypothetical protein
MLLLERVAQLHLRHGPAPASAVLPKHDPERLQTFRIRVMRQTKFQCMIPKSSNAFWIEITSQRKSLSLIRRLFSHPAAACAMPSLA